MSTESYVVVLDDQEVTVQVAQTAFDQVTAIGDIPVVVSVMGGIPGPKGDDGESDSGLMALHILDPTPHPPYDDMPSLTLIFENGLI